MKNARGKIKAYRASGKMFGQTFRTGNEATFSRVPHDRYCPKCGLSCSPARGNCCGVDFWNMPE
jgi:hypothetical protein